MKVREMRKRLDAGEDALELSIEKWQDIVDGTGEELEDKNCALCKLYNKKEENEESNCLPCPIYKRTGKKYCQNTPYEEYYCYPIRGKKKAEAELEFLKSLRPKKGVKL